MSALRLGSRLTVRAVLARAAADEDGRDLMTRVVVAQSLSPSQHPPVCLSPLCTTRFDVLADGPKEEKQAGLGAFHAQPSCGLEFGGQAITGRSHGSASTDPRAACCRRAR
jgi:hypothetical protein